MSLVALDRQAGCAAAAAVVVLVVVVGLCWSGFVHFAAVKSRVVNFCPLVRALNTLSCEFVLRGQVHAAGPALDSAARLGIFLNLTPVIICYVLCCRFFSSHNGI